MKKIIALLMMAVMMLALTGCGGDKKADNKAATSDKKIVLKLSHVFSPDEQLYKSMELVAGRINKKNQWPRRNSMLWSKSAGLLQGWFGAGC